MAINSKLNTMIMLDGGSGKPTTPTYGSHISGSTPSPSVPTPITLPSYSAGLIGQPTVPVSPIGNTVKMPNMNFNSNVVQVGAAQNKGNGGVTDEGVVIGGGATPLPQIKSGSSSGSGSSGSSGAPTYGSWLQNIISKVTGAVGSAANNQKTTLPAQAGQSAQRVNLTADTNNASGATGTGAANEQKTYTSAWAGSEPIDSYEEFLRNKESAYGSMRDEQTQFYDEQSQKALAAIEAQRQAAIAEANNQKTMTDNAATEQKNAALAEAQAQKDLLTTMSQEQRDAVYKFAEEQRISDMNYAAQQYQILLDSINAQKESGMAMAEEQRQLLLSMSEEQRNAIYAAAESQRVAAEQRADVERERGVVDARSSYEQNKASYGANAEAMGSMGLTGSGYSDYLNSKAYAQQRAETQAANAQADASKREARYTEDQARLQADSDYYQNKYNAEQEYSDRKYQIDTTYQNNLLGANQSKAHAEHEATSAERESKFNADQAHAQNKYAAESGYSQSKYEAESAERDAKLQAGLSYSENLFNAESQARSDKLAAEQSADAGKFSAEMSYQQNLLENDDAIGKHRLEQEQKAELEAEQEKADYEALLAAANNGTYTKEQLEQLARDKGLSEEHTNSVLGAADKHTEKVNAGTKVDIDNNYAQGGDTQDYIDEVENAGGLTPEEAQDERRDVYLKDIDTYGTVDMDELKEDLATGKVSQTGYNDIIKKNETAVLKSAKSYISSGGTSSAIALAEEQYSSDAISHSVYQQVYHEIGVAAAKGVTVDNVKNLVKELELWKNSGKISASDYYSLTKYYYGQLGTTVSATESGYKANEKKDGQKWQTFTWNGTNYWADSKENTDADLKNLLNGIATGKEDRSPNIGTLVRYNGKTYAYVNHVVEYGFLNLKTKNVTEWTEIHDNYGNDDYGAQIEAHAEVNEKPAPTHSNNQWSSYEDAAADGYSNIMTRTEWARRKSSTGCNTYQEYLDKMYAKYIG